MARYAAVGRVIPERANVNFGPISAAFENETVKVKATAFVEHSQVSVQLDFGQSDDNLYNIVAISKSVVAPMANYIAFTLPGAYEVVFDLVIDLDRGRHHSISISEPFFDEPAASNYSFSPRNPDDDVSVVAKALYGPYEMRVLEELSNALKRPHLTPMYCRLAIETIRSTFDATDERAGWEKLRSSLNVSRDTIDTFWELAAHQRHGRSVDLNWEKRKNCLRIAWEIANRFLLLKADQSRRFEPL